MPSVNYFAKKQVARTALAINIDILRTAVIFFTSYFKSVKIDKYIAAAMAIFATSSPVFAQSVTDYNVKGVGNQGTQLYAILSAVPPGCNGGIVYHSSDNQAGQYVMSILLSARMTNVPLKRIDYTVRTDGTCWINLVEI